jgi:hypothetical protein
VYLLLTTGAFQPKSLNQQGQLRGNMRNSKFFVSGVIAIGTILGIGVASAADLAARPYTKAPPMVVDPVFNWTGFYIGAQVGGAWLEYRYDNISLTGEPAS